MKQTKNNTIPSQKREYSTDWKREDGEEDEDYEERALEELRDHTTVIEYDGGVVIAAF